MAYRFEDGESLPDGIRRIAMEQVDGAIAELAGRTDDSRDEAVHLARKRLKRIRAVLRLVRDELEPEVFASENLAYRDLGRRLSGVRDAAVLVKTLDAVTGGGEVTGAGSLRAALVERHGALREGAVGLPTALAELATARERITDWPLRWDDFTAIEGGLRRVYRQGRKRMAEAVEGQDPGHWHEWRKRVKDLWHHAQILSCTWPPVLDVLADETHRLSDLLGDEHDLSVLQDTVRSEELASAVTSEAIVALAAGRRASLRAAARPLGERLYAEPPSAFTVRMAAYWDAWRPPR